MPPASDAPPAAEMIRASAVGFAYDGRSVVEDVDLVIHAGEFVGIAGPNGAGKSTLLQLVSGYLHPLRGTVALRGDDMRRLARRHIARSIAVVAQRSDVAFSFSVTEMVLMGRQPYAGLAAFDTAEDLRIAAESLDAVGAAHLAAKPFDQLSGGEQQLVLIARALAQQSAILILDEPTTYLDLKHQWDLLRLLADLNRRGTTILVTLHDLNLAARACSRIVLMKAGRVVADGPSGAVLNEEQLRQVYELPLQVNRGAGGCVHVELPGAPPATPEGMPQ